MSRTFHVPVLSRARDKFLRLGSQRQAIIGGSLGVESCFPEIVEPATGANAAQSQNIFRSRCAPEHAGLFAARADDRLAPGFDNPRTDEEATTTESTILHTLHVADEVAQLLFDRLSSGGASTFLAGGGDELFDFIPE